MTLVNTQVYSIVQTECSDHLNPGMNWHICSKTHHPHHIVVNAEAEGMLKNSTQCYREYKYTSHMLSEHPKLHCMPSEVVGVPLCYET